MKKLVIACVLIAFAGIQSKAQNQSAAPSKKETTAAVHSTGSVSPAPKPAADHAVAPASKTNQPVAPASVTKGKPVAHRNGMHGKKSTPQVKEKNVPVKPMAPGTDEKK